MEIYNKSTPFNIYNVKLFSDDKFKSNNIITMSIFENDDNIITYSFSMRIPNIILKDDTIEIIKNILNKEEQLKVNKSFISFSSIAINENEADKILTINIKKIFNVLVDLHYITENTFVGLAYDNLYDIHIGYFYTDILFS